MEEGTRDQAQCSTRTFSLHKLITWDSEFAVLTCTSTAQLHLSCRRLLVGFVSLVHQEDDDGVGHERRTMYLLPMPLHLLCSNVRTQMVTGLDIDEQKQYPCSPIRGMNRDLGVWSRKGERWDWSRICGHSGHSEFPSPSPGQPV